MNKLLNTPIEEVLLDHELDFVMESPDENFQEYLIDQSEDTDRLVSTFDAAVQGLPTYKTKATPGYSLDEKQSILEDLLKNAKQLGLTIDVNLEDIPLLEEEALDLYISHFTTDQEDGREPDPC